MQTETAVLSLLGSFQDAGLVPGSSPAVSALNAMVEQLARTTIPVLLVGESGTGKEVYARMIHSLGGGGSTGMKKISCAAMEPARLSQALKEFCVDGEPDKVQTLFFDEIEELTPECQKLLLTLVPNGEFQGGEGKVRGRIISATSHDMEQEVREGKFRRELYFRLNGASLRLPALKDRTEDIPAFLQCFLNRHAEELKKSAPTVNHETLGILKSYHWPGNIRELENVARKMVALGDTILAISDLRVVRPAPVSGIGIAKISSLKVAARAASRQTERELILQALQRTKWNRKQAARELQISYKSLLYKLKQIEAVSSKGEE